MSEKRWRFEQWYGMDDDNNHTIEGKRYKKLIELCSASATYFRYSWLRGLRRLQTIGTGVGAIYS